jgi:hypothetical protein
MEEDRVDGIGQGGWKRTGWREEKADGRGQGGWKRIGWM